MKIKVEQRHIDAGQTNSCFHCPIALAVNDAGLRNASVNTFAVGYYEVSRRYEKYLPQVARQFITDFDAGRSVKPFEFEL